MMGLPHVPTEVRGAGGGDGPFGHSTARVLCKRARGGLGWGKNAIR